ncbi:NACHT, LRR and PYD domains-containing protein 3-like isoform X1 [Acipenser ruthenus]|uniref:NACHT, LRR and PYD domains-containing protein 3-like isoform X1 n=1 Tax=Acipenser ruthenus TaxID=7906 RepID=UPI0027404EA6|nr:NACHT, LRR and PYD domains-containing protein 3-like isoform X1 [Acipenser ruthenus]
MTTSTKDLILKELEELLQEEYRRFTWKLRDMGLKEGYKHIPKSQLENAERIDVVDKVIDFYGDDYAVEVTAETLVAINKLDRADRLKRDVQKFTETVGKNPQTLSADTPVTRSRLPVALQRLKDDHKSFLKRKFECVSECIAKPGEQSLLSEVFTKVHMTEGEFGELNYKHEVREIEVASKKGRSQAQPINCNDIFIPSERSPRIRTVLTKGIAGIGKSFSVQKFILDWAAGNDSSGFDFIYIFPFRELNLIKKEISLVELVQLYYPHLKEWEDVSSADSKVLFIFDGLDESRLELDFASCMKLSDTKTATALDVLLVNLIKGDLLLSAFLWITSRPAATSQIPSEHISRVTEIQGFEDQQKEEYFRKRFKDQTLTEKIISHMRTLRSLHVMCYVPAFCWIIATVLGHTLGENGNENIPRTLTEVYTNFVLVLLTLQNKKHKNREELLKQNQEAILNLGKLAFRNLERNKLIFYEHDLRECDIDIRQSSVYSGVCREIFKEDPTFLKDTVYSFVHLTVQEYFAALYVFTSFQNKTALKKLLFALCRYSLCDVYNNALSKASKSRNGHLDLFLRFLLGLGMEKNQKLLKGLLLKTEDNLTDIQKTTKYIKQLIKMNTSPERSLNLFHCLSELNDNSLVEEIKVSLTSGNLSRQKLSSSDYSALAYVLLMSEDELDILDLSRHSLGDEALLRLMPAARLHKRLMLERCDLTGDCCEDLASALCTNQSTLRELQLRGNKLGESGMKLTATLKHPNCKLEKLGLEWCGLTGDCCEDLASALCTNQSTLRELELRGNNLGESGMKLTAALKHPNCKLEKLGLKRCDLTEDCCEDLASALCRNQSTLRELQLRGNKLGESGMKLTAALKHPNCKLEKLGLEWCDLTENCCEDLASALCTNQSTLRELQLRGNKLGESGMKLTAALKHPNCKLEKLGLERCDLTGDCCEDLASALCTNQSTLRELELRGNKLGESGMKLTAALKHPNCKLEKLGLEGCDLTGNCCEDLASALCTNQSTLRELQLRKNNLGESGMKLTAALKHPNCKLEKLGLEWCDLRGDCCEDLASALCTNQSTLRELQLGWNNLGESGIKLLTAAVKHPNCKLEKLWLGRCDLTGDCCEHLASALCTNQSTLRELELRWNKLGELGMKLTAALKHPNCKLEKLGLELCDLTGDCCEDLASALCTNQSTLRELQLRGNKLGESGMKLTAALKHPNCKLEKLGLKQCGLTGDCCEDLASALCTNQSTLRELQLGWNKLGESGMKLTAALKHPNCKLEKLGLGRCDLTGDCCEDLASALCTNQSTLKELELRWNKLGELGMKLTAALKHPNCKLEKLGLEQCGLTGDCCEDLASALCTNQSTLRELELKGNNLGESGMKLTAALKHPNCKLHKLGLVGNQFSEEEKRRLKSLQVELRRSGRYVTVEV